MPHKILEVKKHNYLESLIILIELQKNNNLVSEYNFWIQSTENCTIEEVYGWIKKGCDNYVKAYYGYTPSLRVSARFSEYLEEDSIAAGLYNHFLRLIHDPSKNNKAIILAAKYDRLNIFKFLLKDERVNPISKGNRTLLYAITNNNIDMTKMLLEHEKVIRCMKHFSSSLIKVTLFLKREEILQLLLENQNIEMSFEENALVKFFLQIRRFEIVQKIIKHPKFTLTQEVINLGMLVNFFTTCRK